VSELNLARDIKGHKESFYRYVSDKRKTRENVGRNQENWLPEIWRRLRYSRKFCLSLHRQVLQPYHPSCRRQRQGLTQ